MNLFFISSDILPEFIIMAWMLQNELSLSKKKTKQKKPKQDYKRII